MQCQYNYGILHWVSFVNMQQKIIMTFRCQIITAFILIICGTGV